MSYGVQEFCAPPVMVGGRIQPVWEGVPAHISTGLRISSFFAEKRTAAPKIRPGIGRVARQPPQTPMRHRGYTACGEACFRGAGPVPWHRHQRAVVPSHGLVAEDERRRTSRGRHPAPRAPQESGATIPGTQRRPGQTDTRARGTNDHRPPTRHPPPTIDYHGPAPFSSFREPQGGISD